MVEAGDFVDGSDVSWVRLATTLMASWILAALTGILDAFWAGVGGVLDLVESSGFALAGLWTRAVGIVTSGLKLALEEFDSTVDLLGPVALPLAAVVIVGMLWITEEVIDRVGI